MRLTEEMVIARSKQSDLHNIRRLNLWGGELSDVSILKKMGSIEVLALSVNNISSLQAFENCYNLEELYLRRNKVSDFKELYYLQKLPKLKHLWLDENPCSSTPGVNYRAKVLSILPNLVKLDDKEVTQDDLEMAERLSGESGRGDDDISPPLSPDISQQEMLYEQPTSQPQTRAQRELQRTPPPQMQTTRQQQQQQAQQNYAPQRQQISPQREQIKSLDEHTTANETKAEILSINSNQQLSPSTSSQPSTSSTQDIQLPATVLAATKLESNGVKENLNSNSLTDRSPGSDLESNIQNEYTERAPPMHPSCSTQSMKEYYQSDRPVHQPANYRHSQTDLTEWEEHQQQHQQQQQPQHHQQQHQNPHHPPPTHAQSQSNNHYSNNHQQPQYQSTNDVYGSTQTINYAPRNSLGSAGAPRNGMICRENGDEWDDGRSSRIRRSEGRFYDAANMGSTPALHHHGYHRRPASRSANLLSATLCLIKELDYSSLEVIEHAVRCRIDELSND